ncbi:hypothetical protein AMJ44_09000 [candidate division WOR-1 bacterium DG_54_3]|uniref:Uncharacterized protein n=1 Tax=candidate division WOR-1 bacterium DG_54_3 TaxID=1703775 RepID=A0A0S7XUJ0_UNCSA|nr:MAG: hypothetical protein AMJ44_09000 [candidate division WOR-1 bacterium DG_54_3]
MQSPLILKFTEKLLDKYTMKTDMITLRGGMNITKERLAKAGHPSPLPEVRIAKSTAQAQEIQRMISTEEPRIAASYLYAQGIKEIIVEDKQEGENTLSFDPAYYASLTEEKRKVSIEHELWHVYLNSAFPGYQREIKHLGWTMKTRFRFLSHFLKRFEHFFLRSAAIEAGRYQFAASDSDLGLDLALSQIPELKASPVEIASSYVGMILAHAFPFRSFKPLFNSHLERIKDETRRQNMFRAFFSHNLTLFRERIKKTYKEFSDENIFRAFYDHAESIFNFCREEKDEIRMEDLATPVFCLWLVFLENYFPSLL